MRIEGLLTSGNVPGWVTPDNVPDENFWYWIDLPSLYGHAGLEPRDYLIDAGAAANPGGYPIGGQTKIELRNEHLQYVVIWYALAACLGMITYLMLRNARRNKSRRRIEDDQQRAAEVEEEKRNSKVVFFENLLDRKEGDGFRIICLIDKLSNGRAEYEFTTSNKALHKLWIISNSMIVSSIKEKSKH